MKAQMRLLIVVILAALALSACLAPAAEVTMDKPAQPEAVMEKTDEAATMEKDEASIEKDEAATMEKDEASMEKDEASMEKDGTMDQAELILNLAGLENLGPDYTYEGWLIVEGSPVSSGIFMVDDEGMLSSDIFSVDAAVLSKASAFVLTIEPYPDADPAPSSVHLLAGEFDGNSAELSTAHPAALGSDFSQASGVFILGIPSSDSSDDSYRSGIWFTGLDLPELPAGWVYEGWVASPEGPLSTGRFSDAKAADSVGTGPTAGPKAGPAFPGQDYLNPPMDLTQGYLAVISIEPEPDNSPAPFALKPLVGEIADAGDHVSQDLDNNAAGFPSGMASRKVSEMMDQAGEMDQDVAEMGPAWFDAELVDVNTGQAFRINDYKGQVILVETIATWCPNCMHQQNQVKKLHDTLGDDQFVTVILDIDPNGDPAALQSYTERNGFPWVYAVAPRDVSREIGQLYGDQFLNPPSTPMLIIDQHGQVHTLPFGIKDATTLKDALMPFLNGSM